MYDANELRLKSLIDEAKRRREDALQRQLDTFREELTSVLGDAICEALDVTFATAVAPEDVGSNVPTKPGVPIALLTAFGRRYSVAKNDGGWGYRWSLSREQDDAGKGLFCLFNTADELLLLLDRQLRAVA